METDINDFLAECCVSSPTLTVSSFTLYGAYLDWQHAAGRPPISYSHFRRQLAALKVASFRSHGKTRYRGVGLRSQLAGQEVAPK